MATRKQSVGVEVLLLRDCVFGAAGELVTLSELDAQSGAQQNMLDVNLEALAAAKNGNTQIA